MRVVPLVSVLMLATLAGHAGAQTPTASAWQAASGLLPTQVCPAWTLTDTSASDAVLAPTGLTIADSAGEDLFYVQTDVLDVVPVPEPIVFEASMRFVSGTSSADNRAPANVVVTTAAGIGTLFGIGADQIFLTGAGDVRAQTAAVDTNDASHTYRIEITAAGGVTVFYDGVGTLTGSTYTSPAAFGPVRRIIWGEGSNVASGAHVWTSVAHNLATCPSGTTTLAATTTMPTTTLASTTLAPTTTTPPTTASPTTTAPPTTAAPTTTTPPTTAAPTTTTPTTGAPTTTAPAGPTTTSTTKPPKPTTTTSTSLPPPDCGDDVEPGTVNAVRCRLGVLADQLDAANGLGPFRPKLEKTLAQARGRVDEAASACDAGDDKTASRRMKQAGKFLQKMTHRLGGLSARRKLDADLRAQLKQVIESIRADVANLRKRPCGS